MSTVQGMKQMECKERKGRTKINTYTHLQPSQPDKKTHASLQGLPLAWGQIKNRFRDNKDD